LGILTTREHPVLTQEWVYNIALFASFSDTWLTFWPWSWYPSWKNILPWPRLSNTSFNGIAHKYANWCSHFRYNYGSATLAGLPDLLLGKLQSVLNAATWLVCFGRKYNHVTPLLCDYTGCRFWSASCFVWLCLPIGANIVWHRLICQLIFTVSRILTPVGDFDPHRRQCSSFHLRDSWQLVNELSQLPLHVLGTIYHPVSLQRPLHLLSERLKAELFSRRFCLNCWHAYACNILHDSHLCIFSFSAPVRPTVSCPCSSI